MNNTITEQDIINEVRRLAADNPDYIYVSPGGSEYSSCVYIHDGKGSCIVGRALVNNGFDPEKVSQHEGLTADEMLVALGIKEETDFEQVWLDRVQTLQDSGTPWADAVEEADLEE